MASSETERQRRSMPQGREILVSLAFLGQGSYEPETIVENGYHNNMVSFNIVATNHMWLISPKNIAHGATPVRGPLLPLQEFCSCSLHLDKSYSFQKENKQVTDKVNCKINYYIFDTGD